MRVIACEKNNTAPAVLPTGAGMEKRSERAVSRVLSPRLPGAMIISLGPALLRASSDLPGSLGRAVLIPGCPGSASLCGLAPGGVFQASRLAAGPGGLLPHRFTLTLSGGLLFCGTVHGVAPCPVSGPPCPAELGLSSPLSGSDHLARSDYDKELL